MREARAATSYEQFSDAIALVTMVRDDHAYLAQWISHYTRELPEARFYVLDHGSPDSLRDFVARSFPPEVQRQVNILELPAFRFDDEAKSFHVSQLANLLLYSFGTVIASDVDEILVPSPFAQTSLQSSLQALETPYTCPIGVDIVQDVDKEPAFDFTGDIRAQRQVGYLNSSYSKPVIWKRRAAFSAGLHGLSESYSYTTDILLCHLQNVDQDTTRHREGVRRETDFSDRQIASRQGAFWKAAREDMFAKLRSQPKIWPLGEESLQDFRDYLHNRLFIDGNGIYSHGVNQRSPFYRIGWAQPAGRAKEMDNLRTAHEQSSSPRSDHSCPE